MYTPYTPTIKLRTVGLAVVLHQVPRDAVDLHRQLPRRRYDHRARAVAWHEARLVHQLHARDEERQRLAGSCIGNIPDVSGRGRLTYGLPATAAD